MNDLLDETIVVQAFERLATYANFFNDPKIAEDVGIVRNFLYKHKNYDALQAQYWQLLKQCEKFENDSLILKSLSAYIKVLKSPDGEIYIDNSNLLNEIPKWDSCYKWLQNKKD